MSQVELALDAQSAWRRGVVMVMAAGTMWSLAGPLVRSMDGAGPWQRFRHVTLPLLRPTLLLGAILISVGYLQFFEEPYVMTQGGPLDSTLSATYFTYNQFGFGRYGAAAAASYVLFAAIAVVSLVQFRFLRAKNDVAKAGDVIRNVTGEKVHEFVPERRLDAFDQLWCRRRGQKLVEPDAVFKPESVPQTVKARKVYVLDGRDRDSESLRVALMDFGVVVDRAGLSVSPLARLR